MTLYVRAYADYSYEIIFLDGFIRKSRIHLLINPGKYINLPGKGTKDNVEINIESLTHILAMETSVRDPKLIERTTYIAERTNKPIITNQETGALFRENGLSVKQLRIIGFEREVVEGIHVDPVYLDELSDEIKAPQENQSTLSKLVENLNPLNLMKNITKPFTGEESSKQEIDDTKPLAFHIELGSKMDLLLPLDKRGVLNINRMLPSIEKSHILLLPNQNVGYSREINPGINKLVILNNSIVGDRPLIIPKSHNPDLHHNTLLAALEEWIEID